MLKKKSSIQMLRVTHVDRNYVLNTQVERGVSESEKCKFGVG
jgi:hypothetical protein